MTNKIYFHLLILCGIFCQGISASLSDEDDGESSNILVRKRRVLSKLPGGIAPTPIDQANYIVNIKEHNRAKCAGAILSHYTVITAALCVLRLISAYNVLSGSAYDRGSVIHGVTSKAVYYGHPPHQNSDGIALITVDPPFHFSRNTGFIQLHGRSLFAGAEVTVKGWGCGYVLERTPPGVQRRLRSITLPLMSNAECKNIYQTNEHHVRTNNVFVITDKHLCTYDPHQYCAHTDAGAPLVFNYRLAGIHVWKGQFDNRINPDVYIDLNRPEYNTWIRENTLLM